MEGAAVHAAAFGKIAFLAMRQVVIFRMVEHEVLHTEMLRRRACLAHGPMVNRVRIVTLDVGMAAVGLVDKPRRPFDMREVLAGQRFVSAAGEHLARGIFHSEPELLGRAGRVDVEKGHGAPEDLRRVAVFDRM